MSPKLFALCILAGLPGVVSAQDLAGVTNFHKVNSGLFRGAQPTPEGFRELGKLGVKTVVDLREAGYRSQAEKKVVEAAGMRYVSIPMSGLGAPTVEQVTRILSLFNDGTAGPVFVHCRRGADRTGTVVAVYRISHDGWDNARALGEAKAFGMAWFEQAMQRYVLDYRPDRQVAGTPAVTPAPALALAPVN